MKVSNLTGIPPYESPLVRVVWVNPKGAILDTSSRNAEANGFDSEWDENFWGE